MEIFLIVVAVLGLYFVSMLISMRFLYRMRKREEQKYRRGYVEQFMLDPAWWAFWMSFIWPLVFGWQALRVWIRGGHDEDDW